MKKIALLLASLGTLATSLPAGQYRVSGKLGDLRLPSVNVDLTSGDQLVSLDFTVAESLRPNLGVDSYTNFAGQQVYSTFDWGIRDADGYYFILGRTDDVINVAGHRLGTREIEQPFVEGRHLADRLFAHEGAGIVPSGEMARCVGQFSADADRPGAGLKGPWTGVFHQQAIHP